MDRSVGHAGYEFELSFSKEELARMYPVYDVGTLPEVASVGL